MNGKETNSDIPGNKRISFIAPSKTKGKLFSKNLLYTLDSGEKKIIKLDKKNRVENSIKLDLDNRSSCSSFLVTYSPENRANYIFTLWKKKPFISTNELFKKYGDPEFEKKRINEIAENSFKKYKTWNFSAEVKKDIEDSLRRSKFGYLQRKFGLKLIPMQEPPPVVSVILLRDKGGKMEIIKEEVFDNYVIKDLHNDELVPIEYLKPGGVLSGYFIFLNEYKKYKPSDYRAKSIVKLIEIDKQ
jgi:hypothetical protein